VLRATTTRRIATVTSAAMVLLAVGAVATAATASPSKAKALIGRFAIAPGTSSSGAVIGSSFRMVQPGGTVANGPYVPNVDSSATDKTYTLLTPGTDGGLVTGKHQPAPNPPFDAAGNGTAAAIITPTKFFGVNFALATNKTDPQTGKSTKVPGIKVAKNKLTGDLDALGVDYGKQHFNQGSPKPDGSSPGGTAGPTGTYDAKTGRYSLTWSSAIVGGPFNGFTGVWHLEGTFQKAK
jgi:hypothetical protein